jgi:Na+-translocating ferredoxin:NAD+ oxidoreductase RnfG subunit
VSIAFFRVTSVTAVCVSRPLILCPRLRLVLIGALFALPPPLQAQEGIFLAEAEAPKAVFPDADTFERHVVAATPELRDRLRVLLRNVEPSIWEAEYVTFTVSRGTTAVGYAIIVEEIGKHRPITFVVGVRPDGRVNDVAVMAYREAYGGEVRSERFLKQYRDKTATSTLATYGDIKNIAGATLSVDAASRAVKKALAVAQLSLAAGGMP